MADESDKVLVAGDSGTRLWRLVDATWEDFRLEDLEAYSVAISPDGRWGIAGHFDGTCRVWDLTSDNPALSSTLLEGHEGHVRSLSFSRNGNWLATCCYEGDSRLFIWDARIFPEQQTPNTLDLRPDSEFMTFANQFAEGRDSLVTTDTKGLIREWRVENGAPRLAKTIQKTGGWVNKLAISKNNRWIAIVGGEEALLFDQEQDGPPIKLSGFDTKRIFAMCMSPNDRWLAVGAFDGLIYLWDLSTGDADQIQASRRTLKGHESFARPRTFTADSKRLISSDKTGRLVAWLVDLEELEAFTQHSVARELTTDERAFYRLDQFGHLSEEKE